MGTVESGIRGSEFLAVTESYSHRRSEHAIRVVGMAVALAMADDRARQQAIRSLFSRDDCEIHYPAPAQPTSENDVAFEALLADEFPPDTSLHAQFSFPGHEEATIRIPADDETFEIAQDEFNEQEAAHFGMVDGYELCFVELKHLGLRRIQRDVQQRETITDLAAHLTDEGAVTLTKARYGDREPIEPYIDLEDDLIVATAITRLRGLNQPRAKQDVSSTAETTALS